MRPFLHRLLPDHLFVVRCFRENKFLFVLLVLFLSLAAYDHYTGNEISPAFVFSMFSQKHVSTKGNFFLMRLDNRDTLNLYSTLDEPRRMMIFSTLSAYHDGVLAGNRDPHEDAVRRLVAKHPFMSGLSRDACNHPADYDRYLPWLRHYIENAVGHPVSRMDIDQVWFHYDARNLPVTDSTTHLYSFE